MVKGMYVYTFPVFMTPYQSFIQVLLFPFNWNFNTGKVFTKKKTEMGNSEGGRL